MYAHTLDPRTALHPRDQQTAISSLMSFHAATVSVVIGEPPSKGYWTDGERVDGYVELDVQREITVASIEAQLRCEDRGRVFYTDSEDVVDLSMTHKDTTDILWGSETVSFPLPSHQIAKGQHKFPFSFILPQDAHKFPSSFNIEGNHDFNGTFWGVWAVVDREQRLRSNYRGFGEILMFPHRLRTFTGDEDSYTISDHTVHLRLHRRPSFMLHDGDQTLLGVEGRLKVPKEGLIQSHKSVGEHHESPYNISADVRTLNGDEKAIVKEITVFVDTVITTSADSQTCKSNTTAIALSAKFSEPIHVGRDWVDLSSAIAGTRISGLAESFSTAIHKYAHSLRVQLVVAPESKPGKYAFLEMSVPVILHSEAATTSDKLPPPY